LFHHRFEVALKTIADFGERTEIKQLLLMIMMMMMMMMMLMLLLLTMMMMLLLLLFGAVVVVMTVLGMSSGLLTAMKTRTTIVVDGSSCWYC